MRVVDRSIYLRLLTGLSQARERSTSALESLSDGKQVRVGSDDPGAVRESLALRARVARLAGLDGSANAARTDLATIDSVLGEVTGILTEARDEALAGASAPFDEANEVRAAAIDDLREQLLSLANTDQRGRYLFGGTETLAPPFATDGSYVGNGDEVQAPLDDEQQVGSTFSGNRIFLDGGDVFRQLEDLAQALRDNDTDAVSALVPGLGTSLDHLGEMRAEVGHRLSRIDRVQQRHADESLTLLQRISGIEDADLARVIVDLEAAGTSAEALSAAAARVLGRSLFDFLG